jgi:hypothetical protein
MNVQRAWLTAVANDNYVTPTLAMARTLDEFSCVKTKIALVPEDLGVVSETTRDLLRRAGFEVQVKPSLDCMSAHGSGASEIALYPGTAMLSPHLISSQSVQVLRLMVQCVCVCDDVVCIRRVHEAVRVEHDRVRQDRVRRLRHHDPGQHRRAVRVAAPGTV